MDQIKHVILKHYRDLLEMLIDIFTISMRFHRQNQLINCSLVAGLLETTSCVYFKV